MTIKNNPDFADRTLLSMRALVRIYQRMAQKVEYQQEMKDIRTDIFLKGDTFAKHSLQCNSLIGKFSKPYLREGMVSLISLINEIFIDHFDSQLLLSSS